MQIRGGSTDGSTEPMDRLRAALERRGQGHVFAWEPELSPTEIERLEGQLRDVDLDLIEALLRGEGVACAGDELQHIEPAEVLRLGQEPAGSSRVECRKRGEALLRAGKVGAFLVAGGQGSRLGFEGPKGCLPVGPLSNDTLFRMHAGKLVRLAELYGASVPWYIMTSGANDAETRATFEANAFFGLDPADVLFLEQGTLPAVDAKGRLILASKSSLFTSPDGHGGCYRAFRERGGLEHARKRGLEHIFFFQVDNPLIRIADPEFLGLHAEHQSEYSLCVLEKTGPGESIGVVTRLAGRHAVVEYSDLSEEQAKRRDADGRLVFGYGSIAIHAFRLGFIERVASGDIRLPYHVAKKKVSGLATSGELAEIDGRKFETFVFDTLPFTESCLHVEVDRARSFAPIKNARGVDSLESAQKLLSDEHRRWLQTADIEASGRVEISSRVAIDEADLAERLAGRSGTRVEGDVHVRLDTKGRVVF